MGSVRGKIEALALSAIFAFTVVWATSVPATSFAQTNSATTTAQTTAAATAQSIAAQSTSSNSNPLNVSQNAQPPSNQKLAAVLKFVYENESLKHGWPANYEAMWCPTNVFNLLRRLDEAKVDISNAQVLYIVPSFYSGKKGDSFVRPRVARVGPNGPVREWTFHVILLIEGKILDLDFTNEPVVVELNDYFGRMFGKGPLAVQPAKADLYFRSIPAADYYSSYTGNWEWYAKGGGGRYPAINLETLFAPQTNAPFVAGF